MTIGKRKGSAAKGVGGTGVNNVNKVGGSLSKNDHWYLQQAFGVSVDPGAVPTFQATGGQSTAEYTDPVSKWKAHKFTATGSFVVTDNGGPGSGNIEYLVIGAGGGGGASGPSGYHGAGGGGGGCIKTNMGNNDLALGMQTYTVTVGDGGPAGTGDGPPSNPGGPGAKGGDSSIAGPDITTITAGGGGGAMGSQSNPDNSWPSPIGGKDTGGSPLPGGGSGAGGSPYPIAATGQVSTGAPGHPGAADVASPPLGWGNDGGDGPANSMGAGGGGGAAVVGGNETSSFNGGPGGNGAAYTIYEGPTAPVSYGGGGGGGGGNPPATLAPGGTGGGGAGALHPNPSPSNGVDGTANTGGGGGGGAQSTAGGGGSGIVIIRYKVL